jgi:hypothetical protein
LRANIGCVDARFEIELVNDELTQSLVVHLMSLLGTRYHSLADFGEASWLEVFSASLTCINLAELLHVQRLLISDKARRAFKHWLCRCWGEVVAAART